MYKTISPYRLFTYRAALPGGADDDLLENWRRVPSIWTDQDRKVFDASITVKKSVTDLKRPTKLPGQALHRSSLPFCWSIVF
jgi:hypothetical protein